MVSLVVIFWMYVILFAIIGAMRGWARELLVTFAAILALFFITVMERFAPSIVGKTLESMSNVQFWLRTIVILGLVFFGYQSPNIPKLATQARFARDRLQDILLGVFMGAFNGYLVTGSVWFYLNTAKYPFKDIIDAPTGDVLELTNRMMELMPPQLLGANESAAIYFAVALAFAFVLVVFI